MTTRIVRFHKYGGPEVLQIEQVPIRQPGKGEVRIKVQAIGLNRAEAMWYHGTYLYEVKLPATIGYEAAGIVEAVGPDVDKSWIGKKVASIPGFYLNDYGALGEQVVMPVSALGEYPNNLTPIQASAIWMQYITAYGALISIAGLTKGEFVIITAASSSVGVAAIEIAKAEGAISIATTRKSDKKAELLKLGANHVIAIEEEDFVQRVKEITGGKGARVVFDPVGGPFFAKLTDATAVGGIIFEYGLLSDQPTPLPLVSVLTKSLTIRGWVLWEHTMQQPEKLAQAKKYICERLADGRFNPKIAKTFPFEQTVEAYKYLESNAQIGKVVITVP